MSIKLRNMTAVYLMKDNQFLLLYRQGGKVVNEVYTGTAGGHFEKDELGDPTACLLREMKEEIGLTEDMVENLKLRYVAARYTKGEIRQNFYYFAEISAETAEVIASNEGALRWVNFEDALNLEMPFCAKFAIEHYLKIGRYDDLLYGGMATQTDLVFAPMSE